MTDLLTLQLATGYFEASPNHDAVALGVVNETLAEKIVSKIKSLGTANISIPTVDVVAVPP